MVVKICDAFHSFTGNQILKCLKSTEYLTNSNMLKIVVDQQLFIDERIEEGFCYAKPGNIIIEEKGTGDKHFVIGAWSDWDNSNVNRKSFVENYVNEIDVWFDIGSFWGWKLRSTFEWLIDTRNVVNLTTTISS